MTLNIYSDPAFLPLVRSVTEKMCELLGFDEVAVGMIVLSVDEALTNIIKHAYHGCADKKIDIEISAKDNNCNALKISMRDYGQYVDPANIKSRDLADVRPGGLGVHIISKCMDSMNFSPAPGGGTLLTLVKKIPQQQGSKQ